MKIEDIRKLSDEELQGELVRLKRHLYDLRSQAVTEKLADSSRVKKTKCDVARVKTIIRERVAN